MAMTRWIPRSVAAAALVAALGSGGLRAQGSPASAVAPIVVAELFTSEGCSSCPPADTVLQELAAGTLVPGVRVVALSEHVDYWDHLGWRDPFSSRAFSDRQSDYDARVFHANSIYTPQLVVDGRAGMVGSDRAAVVKAVQAAARAAKAPIAIEARRPAGARTLKATVTVSVPPALARSEPSDLVLLVIEGGLASQVRAGENGGRRLTHTGVVRYLGVLATLGPSAHDLSREASIAWKKEWNAARVSVVALLQEQASRRIVGAGMVPVRESAAGAE
jgi:hypothetical protein